MARDDPAAFRRALIAAGVRSADTARAWRDSAPMRRLREGLDGVAGLDDVAATSAARELLAAIDVADVLGPLASALAEDPLFEPPLRVRRDVRHVGAVLIDTTAARITASVTTPASALPKGAIASGAVAVTRYHRAACATLHRWRVAAVDDGCMTAGAFPAEPLPPIALADGDILINDGRVEAQALTGCGQVASLTVLLRDGRGPLSRAYRTRDGAFLRSATTDQAASRAAMLLTLLRASGRADAADAFQTATQDMACHLRWHAMREWLALDAAAALPRLRAMAEDDPHADVRCAARASLALVEDRLRCR